MLQGPTALQETEKEQMDEAKKTPKIKTRENGGSGNRISTFLLNI
jgi:hypothetical protein